MVRIREWCICVKGCVYRRWKWKMLRWKMLERKSTSYQENVGSSMSSLPTRCCWRMDITVAPHHHESRRSQRWRSSRRCKRCCCWIQKWNWTNLKLLLIVCSCRYFATAGSLCVRCTRQKWSWIDMNSASRTMLAAKACSSGGLGRDACSSFRRCLRSAHSLRCVRSAHFEYFYGHQLETNVILVYCETRYVRTGSFVTWILDAVLVFVLWSCQSCSCERELHWSTLNLLDQYRCADKTIDYQVVHSQR